MKIRSFTKHSYISLNSILPFKAVGESFSKNYVLLILLFFTVDGVLGEMYNSFKRKRLTRSKRQTLALDGSKTTPRSPPTNFNQQCCLIILYI